MTGDDWTAAAMRDGSLVADLLVHLRRATFPENPEESPPPLRWRVRQRRSRPMSSKSTATASPTTPLSWSGGATSVSGCRLDDSALPLDAAVRSKLIDASESTTSKRSRKKKTLAELKEDEALIMKERKDLKQKLDSLRVTVEIERATNNRLKRLKLDYVSRSSKSVTILVPAEENPKMVSSYIPLSADSKINNSKSLEHPGLSMSPKLHEEVTNLENKFILPDLNLPIED